MKRIGAIFLVCILMTSVTACGRNGRNAARTQQADTPEKTAVAQSISEAKPEGTEANAAPVSKAEQTARRDDLKTESQVSSTASGVVAKSTNAVSSQDKEAVLKELDKELDALFNSINSLEDIQDSDLKIN